MHRQSNQAPDLNRADASMVTLSDELTSRERGLIVGHAYASRYEGDRAKLRPIVMAGTADEVKANVDSTVIEPAGRENSVAFWSGFAHGVAAFLVEDARR